MRSILVILSVASLIGASAPARAEAPGTTAYADLLGHYEAIRLSLLAETTAGVEKHAKAIAATAAELHRDFDPVRAGVEIDKSKDCRELLPDLQRSAARLASAKSMEEAVEAFGELSQPMVRFRSMAKDESSIVVYCPMVKKAWLQPEGEIGNPYGGKDMARCGDVISNQ